MKPNYKGGPRTLQRLEAFSIWRAVGALSYSFVYIAQQELTQYTSHLSFNLSSRPILTSGPKEFNEVPQPSFIGYYTQFMENRGCIWLVKKVNVIIFKEVKPLNEGRPAIGRIN